MDLQEIKISQKGVRLNVSWLTIYREAIILGLVVHKCRKQNSQLVWRNKH